MPRNNTADNKIYAADKKHKRGDLTERAGADAEEHIKNAVILIARIRELCADDYEPINAVIEATADRFIPVVAASLTTILGMIPLLADSMFGSMAATIMGGLLVATLMVLVVLPVVYSLFYRIKL